MRPVQTCKHNDSYISVTSIRPVLKVDNIGGFKVGQGVLGLVLALTHFIVQLRTLRRKPKIRYCCLCNKLNLKRAKERCVLVWDGDSVRLEELLGAIQALRAQFVVSKTANMSCRVI